MATIIFTILGVATHADATPADATLADATPADTGAIKAPLGNYTPVK